MISRFLKSRLIPFYLVGSYLVIAPFLILPELGMYDSKRLLQILLLTTLCFYSLYTSFKKKEKQKIKLSKATTFIVDLIFVLGLISSALSEFPRYAFIEITIFSLLVLYFLELSQKTLSTHYQLGKFVYGIAITFSSIYLLYFFGNYIAAYLNPLVPMWPDRLAVAIQIGDTVHRGTEVLNFAHKRFFNHIQTWTLPLIISVALYFKANKTYRILILGLLTCWWLLVFASGARGTLVAFILACFVLLILFRKRSYRFFAVAAGTALGGFLLYFLMFKVFVPSESLPVARMTDSGRWDMWAKAMEIWLANPLLGAGPMHYAVLENAPYFAHPHNFYLQILAEWGMVALAGFVALLVFYVLFIKKIFLNNNFEFKELGSRNIAIYMGFFGSAVAGFAHAGVSGVLHTPMSQIWAIIVVAWLVSLWNRKSNSKKILYLKRKHLSIAITLFIFGLFFLISPDFNRVYKNHKQYKEQYKESKLYPRFWEQGLIYERDKGGQEKGEKENQDGQD